jgi:hypothetical protein
MKKTYVLQFDYDETKSDMAGVFGVTDDQVIAIHERFRDIVENRKKKSTKSSTLMEILDTGEEVAGGVLAYMLAAHLGETYEKVRSSSLYRLLASLVSSEESLEHDCEHCEAYDGCPLPFKKSRPGQEEGKGEPS